MTKRDKNRYYIHNMKKDKRIGEINEAFNIHPLFSAPSYTFPLNLFPFTHHLAKQFFTTIKLCIIEVSSISSKKRFSHFKS